MLAAATVLGSVLGFVFWTWLFFGPAETARVWNGVRQIFGAHAALSERPVAPDPNRLPWLPRAAIAVVAVGLFVALSFVVPALSVGLGLACALAIAWIALGTDFGVEK